MVTNSSQVIVLSTLQTRCSLLGRARSRAHSDVLRARIVLAPAAGRSNPQIAAEVGLCLDTVRK